MNRIDAAFRRLKKARKPAFVAYIAAGDPNLSASRRLIHCLAENGADVIELGVPFSDPLADGVVNQRAAQRALRAGTSLRKIFALIRRLRREGLQTPIILFTYVNPAHRLGFSTFSRLAAGAGVDGVLLLDMPPEESAQARRALRRHGLRQICLVAPTSSNARIEKICRHAQGFLYCVSRTGVTGAQHSVLDEVKDLIKRIRRKTRLPIAVGFGVSRPEHVRALAGSADGVVVGSALVAQIEKHAGNPVPAVASLMKRLTRPLHHGR